MASGFEEVLLVRHGETEWNVLGRRQGQLDSPLTERGRRQALAVASLASGTEADVVFASPLGRSRATAEPIAAAIGQPVRLLAGLSEIHHGEFAGLTAAEIEARWPGALAEREEQKYGWRFPGGESYRDAARRVGTALDELAIRSARRPILVAHAMVGRLIIGNLLDLSPDEALGWTLPHGTILRLDPNQGRIERMLPK